jgi:7-cyano-7-deazaguanine reductase
MADVLQAPEAAGRRFDVQGYEAIDTAVLETFPYEFPGHAVAVDIDTDEFTAVCPWSGLPDFGKILIRYLPRRKILELRSLKYYLLSYRNVGIYQEHAVNRILDDLVTVVEPQWMEVTLDYKVRGGIHTLCRVRWPDGQTDGSRESGAGSR